MALPKRVVWEYNDSNAKIYHIYTDCPKMDSAKGMKFGTMEDAKALGKDVCRHCFERWKADQCREKEAEIAIALKGVRCVYWREDRIDFVFHFEKDCPELLNAKLIGQGTVEEANSRGKTVLCRKCLRIKENQQKEQEKRAIVQREAEKAQKELLNEEQKKGKATAALVSIFATLIACTVFFSWYTDELSQKDFKEGYDSGYSDGKNAGNDSYDVGYNSGYYNGYKDGIAAGPGSQLSGESSNVQTVYITDNGRKYHNWGCQYLSDYCFALSLDDAIALGYTACSQCQ